MTIARNLLLRAAESRWLADQMARRRFAQRAVRRFMPGETLDAALTAAQALAAHKLGSLITQLGEGVFTADQAAAVRDHYLDAFDQIAARKLPTAVSIKPTQLGLDQSEAECRAHLVALADRAQATGSVLWIDMEDSSYVDRTLGLYRAVHARHPAAGIAIQTYLRRTPGDIEALLPLAPTIRLVKGAYSEAPAVAFPSKREVDVAFFDLGRQLLEAAARGQATPIFGTHDMVLIERLVAAARDIGVADGGYEIHMLYGIGVDNQRSLVSHGRVVKTLISYGSAWFKWYMRRLAERPANIWFVLKSVVS